MLFNFQGPNSLRYEAYLFYHISFRLSSTFFKVFSNSFELCAVFSDSLFILSPQARFVKLFLKTFLNRSLGRRSLESALLYYHTLPPLSTVFIKNIVLIIYLLCNILILSEFYTLEVNYVRIFSVRNTCF